MRDDTANRVGWLLVVIAVPLLVAGMFGLNPRLLLIGAAVAVVGIIVRIARL